ncbi:MAG: hypothetical protein V4636_13030 [Pseudomonadota bacterium]
MNAHDTIQTNHAGKHAAATRDGRHGKATAKTQPMETLSKALDREIADYNKQPADAAWYKATLTQEMAQNRINTERIADLLLTLQHVEALLTTRYPGDTFAIAGVRAAIAKATGSQSC